MGWLVYAAMAAGLLPLLFMGVGYLFVSLRQSNEEGKSSEERQNAASEEEGDLPTRVSGDGS